MKLHYKEIGEGKPFIIIHGLFGQSDNWGTLGRKFAALGYRVFLVDVRNHGKSPHSDDFSYQAMSEDIYELINDKIDYLDRDIVLLGHSMGGKIAMQFAVNHPEMIENLIVADMGPKYRVSDNKEVLAALNTVKLAPMKSRQEAAEELNKFLNSEMLVQFLLKNIHWKENEQQGKFMDWRFNLKVLTSKFSEINKAVERKAPCTVSTLFLRGGDSDYVLEEDYEGIKEVFPNAEMVSIEGAGHWLQAEKPKEFYHKVVAFLG